VCIYILNSSSLIRCLDCKSGQSNQRKPLLLWLQILYHVVISVHNAKVRAGPVNLGAQNENPDLTLPRIFFHIVCQLPRALIFHLIKLFKTDADQNSLYFNFFYCYFFTNSIQFKSF
jgi:hypothetical protein